MAEPDPELVRFAESAYERINAADFEGFRAFVHEDVEFTSMVAEAEGTSFHGHEGLRTWWSTVYGAFEQPHWELLDMQGTAERGIVKFRLTGSMAGVPIDHVMWQAARIRDGKLVWWGFFRSEEEARNSGVERGL